jgi:hypothetical protein
LAVNKCGRCGAEDLLRKVRWRFRVFLALSTGVVILIPGLALTMVGVGLPLLIASPIATLLLLFLPLTRCGNCGHITVRRSG